MVVVLITLADCKITSGSVENACSGFGLMAIANEIGV
jgi:hypothetical protein